MATDYELQPFFLSLPSFTIISEVSRSIRATQRPPFRTSSKTHHFGARPQGEPYPGVQRGDDREGHDVKERKGHAIPEFLVRFRSVRDADDLWLTARRHGGVRPMEPHDAQAATGQPHCQH